MVIRPVTNEHPPACYGMGGCPHHSGCRRYQAVEEVDPNETVSTCSDGKGGWPWYVPITINRVRHDQSLACWIRRLSTSASKAKTAWKRPNRLS